MSTAESPTRLLSAAEFAARADIDGPCELVRGEIVMAPPPGSGHGESCSILCEVIGPFVRRERLGRLVSNDSGVRTLRDPDTVRGADVAFYSYAAVPRGASPEPYPAVPPELVFEVKSPSDRWAAIDEKVAEYLGAGVQVVVVIDPESRAAVIHYAEKPPVSLTEQDELRLPEVLGGFGVKLAELLP